MTELRETMPGAIADPGRRRFLAAAGGFALAAAWPGRPRASTGPVDVRLAARPAAVRLIDDVRPATAVWSYGGTVPGPLIRVPQGTHLRVRVENGLDQPTTVHWHGVRVPNAMDGVPRLTQEPIAPGDAFDYAFDVPDAGTYWYHSHERSWEQVERGLSGVLIVDEPEPPLVDRDVLWLLDDWRLTEDAQIAGGFTNMMDVSHAGRLGNTVTINGRVPDRFPVRSGERIRLRLVNAANGRVFGLTFGDLAPRVIAWDGQPVAPHVPDGGRIVLGPAMRADLILDVGARPGEVVQVVDDFYPRGRYRLVDLACAEAEPLRASPLDAPAALAPNPLVEPDAAGAVRVPVSIEGGAMGRMARAELDGETLGLRELVSAGKAWALNGVAAHRTDMPPLVDVPRGRTCVLDMVNRTAWPHPMHLHGHHFRVLARDGRPTPHREWRDTVLVMPDERVEVAFVADNPGDWLFHCHVLEHHAGGMATVLRVT